MFRIKRMGVQVKGSRGKGRRDRKDWKREREQENKGENTGKLGLPVTIGDEV